MRATRAHRLPQRLDYALIPAPLDLSRPIVDEKATLPAIIVTPSSPAGETDFAIAFLAPPSSPTVLSRLSKKLNLPFTLQAKTRTLLLVLLPLIILTCHLFAHRLSALAHRPKLNFDRHTQHTFASLSGSGGHVEPNNVGGWNDLGDLWSLSRDGKSPRGVVIEEKHH